MWREGCTPTCTSATPPMRGPNPHGGRLPHGEDAGPQTPTWTRRGGGAGPQPREHSSCWPHPAAGQGADTLRLVDIDGGGCRIEMAEMPGGALMTWIPDRLALAAAVPRYWEFSGFSPGATTRPPRRESTGGTRLRNRTNLADSLKFTVRTLADIEHGARKASPGTYAILENKLTWAPGSIYTILAGGNPRKWCPHCTATTPRPRNTHCARPPPTRCRRRPPRNCCSSYAAASSPSAIDATTPGTTGTAALTRTATGPIDELYDGQVTQCVKVSVQGARKLHRHSTGLATRSTGGLARGAVRRCPAEDTM